MKALLAAALLAASCAPLPPPPAPPARVEAPSPPPMTAPSAEPPPPPVDARVERLARLCRVWGQVRYHHPWMVEHAADWDAALRAAIPRVDAAATGAEEDAAVAQMLASLGDPATHLDTSGANAAGATGKPASRWATADTLVLDLGGEDPEAITRLLKTLAADLEKAAGLVVDLRVPRGARPPRWALARSVLPVLEKRLPAHETIGPARRSVVYSGYVPQSGTTSGGYSVSRQTRLPESWPAASGHHPARVVFIADPRSEIPDLAVGLQHDGDAQIVGEGDVGDTSLIRQTGVQRGDRPAVVLRLSDLDEPFHPDVGLPRSTASKGDVALDAALALLKTKPPARAHPKAALAARVAWRPDPVYAGEPFPSREQRLLALFRLWNVIHFFYPYLHLMGDTWDRALTDFIPRFEAARDAREYTLAVMEVAARIPDGHVGVRGNPFAAQIMGAARLPVTVQRIEGLPVITKIDAPEARAAGAAVGDVVISVDGEAIDVRTARLRPYVAASNAGALAYYLDNFALRGAGGSTATLVVRGADESPRELRIPRGYGPETGKAFRVLPEGLGYVDLSLLEVRDVDAMFAALGQTPGIVFDMRGYPHGTAWTIAPRLAVHEDAPAALFARPLIGTSYEDARYTFVQRLGSTTKPHYRGATVMLVDERTMSQAEHTGLFFEAANGTRFVGSPTAGANGDITSTCLPANLCVTFSGHEVRHADGRQLQRVGLTPDVPVRPTLQGLRQGRDEVLERAVQLLRGRGAPVSPGASPPP